MRRPIAPALVLVALATTAAWGMERFPPPEFETDYAMPDTTVPGPRALWEEVGDVAVLVVALAVATWLSIRKRSRRGMAWLGVACLAYFGFFREGCLCPIGAIQNVVLAFADPTYVIPVIAIAVFALPIAVALLFGRSFCGGVCPLGAIQDVIAIKPVAVPAWAERALGMLAWVYLGLAVYLAALGAAFIICRYDPFVGFFRMSAGFDMLVLGAVMLGVGMFVARPYCRFFCPYGAILHLASRLSKWRVRVTPDECIQCRLCEDACPFGAIEPATPERTPLERARARRRVLTLALVAPIVIAACSWVGSRFGSAIAIAHPTVKVALLVGAERDWPPEDVSDETEAFGQTGRTEAALFSDAAEVADQFTAGGWWLGAWVGLVVMVKLIALCRLPTRTDYEADRGNCLACARCFEFCPNEHKRRGGES